VTAIAQQKKQFFAIKAVYFLKRASKALRASCGVAFDSNVRSTKTAGLKKVHSFRVSFGATRAGICLLHSHRELVLKKAQLVQV
jgi:hypothetical protein